MSEAMQCNHCKKYAPKDYDLITNEFKGIKGWTRVILHPQLTNSVSVETRDLCPECTSEFNKFLGYE